MNHEELREAHRHCTSNREEIGRSGTCGCFYCLATFMPGAIERWLQEGDGTACCPQCQIDSVIGDASGLPAGDAGFLREMHAFWFERTVPLEEVERRFGNA